MRLKLAMILSNLFILQGQIVSSCTTTVNSVATSIQVQNISFGATPVLDVTGCNASKIGISTDSSSPYSVNITLSYSAFYPPTAYIKIYDSTGQVYATDGTLTTINLPADTITLPPTPLTQKTGSTSTLTDYVKIEETGGAGSGEFTLTIYTGGSTPTTLPSEYLFLTPSLQITPSDTNFSIGGLGLTPLYGNKNINLYFTINQKGESLWTGCNVYAGVNFVTISFSVQIIATDTWQDVGSHGSRSTISGTCVVVIRGYTSFFTTTIPITDGVFTNVALNVPQEASATTASLSKAGVLSFNS